jgi:hypothetical protein
VEPSTGKQYPLPPTIVTDIVGGVEAVKATISRWSCDRCWCAVLLLEEVAEGELRKLEQMIPGFYGCLGS